MLRRPKIHEMFAYKNTVWVQSKLDSLSIHDSLTIPHVLHPSFVSKFSQVDKTCNNNLNVTTICEISLHKKVNSFYILP